MATAQELADDILSRDPAAVRARIAMLERVLESAILIPGIRRRIGLDAVLGLLPGVGDAMAGAMGLYLVWEARNLGASRFTLARMVGNVLIDTLLGSVPVAGDIFDLFFRSNTRNLKLIRRQLEGR
jgi:hypothetical protein